MQSAWLHSTRSRMTQASCLQWRGWGMPWRAWPPLRCPAPRMMASRCRSLEVEQPRLTAVTLHAKKDLHDVA